MGHPYVVMAAMRVENLVFRWRATRAPARTFSPASRDILPSHALTPPALTAALDAPSASSSTLILRPHAHDDSLSRTIEEQAETGP